MKLRKGLMFYIIKQVLNEPPGWTRILKVGQGGNKRNHVYMAISFCCALEENHPGT